MTNINCSAISCKMITLAVWQDSVCSYIGPKPDHQTSRHICRRQPGTNWVWTARSRQISSQRVIWPEQFNGRVGDSTSEIIWWRSLQRDDRVCDQQRDLVCPDPDVLRDQRHVQRHLQPDGHRLGWERHPEGRGSPGVVSSDPEGHGKGDFGTIIILKFHQVPYSWAEWQTVGSFDHQPSRLHPSTACRLSLCLGRTNSLFLFSTLNTQTGLSFRLITLEITCGSWKKMDGIILWKIDMNRANSLGITNSKNELL